MVIGVDIAASVAGLAKFLLDLIDLASSLIGSVSKCSRILRDLETLLKVLERVRDGYGKTVSLLQSPEPSGLQIVNSLLARCIDDCIATCKEYDAILKAILRSRIRALKWRSSQDDLKQAASRLEANKSTLSLCLSSISEERERLKAVKGNVESSPPPYQSYASQYQSYPSPYQSPSPYQPYPSPYQSYPSGSYFPTMQQNSTPAANTFNAPLVPSPSTSCANNICPSDCTLCYQRKMDQALKESQRRHDQGLTSLCSSDCVLCYQSSLDQSLKESQKRHDQGLTSLCSSDCVLCYQRKLDQAMTESQRRHDQGLTSLCSSDCNLCYQQKSDRIWTESHKRHNQGLNHLCPSDCGLCYQEKSDRAVSESYRRHGR